MNKWLNSRNVLNNRGPAPLEIGCRRQPSDASGVLSLTGFTPLKTIVKLASNRMSLTGFTLAEVILAAAILVFALTGLLALFISCMLLNESSRNRATAIAQAQYVMEEIKNTNFDVIETNINAANWNWDEAEIENASLPVLKSELITTTVPASGDPAEVLVEVEWQDRLGGAQTISLTSIFTDIY